MDLMQTDVAVFWLYAGLFGAGLVVWAWVALAYSRRRPCLKIEPWPDGQAVGLGAEAIFLVLIFFLFAEAILRQGIQAWTISVSGPEEIALLSQSLVADVAGKLIVSGLMIYLLRKRIPGDRLFKLRGVPDGGGRLRRLPVGLRVVLFAVVLYLAIFPLVNDVILRLSVFLIQGVLDISVPEKHQAFELLDHSGVAWWIKGGTLLLAGVISPVAEELFFRGLIQNVIYKSVRHPAIAIGITAFLFMLVHVPMYHQLPALGVLGGILGWSYYRYRSLAVPIVTHILFNCTTLLFWWLGGTS